MIRFCDMEVYKVYENEIDRGQLFSFFCNNNHNNDIIIVYNEINEFKGIITYDRILTGNKEVIQTEKVLINNDIWKNAKKIFNERNDIIYLPVFTEEFELLYFCYDDNSEKTYYNVIEKAFEQFELNSECLFINEFYPKVQVICIYDMNEYAFRLYNLLSEKKINTIVIGQKWNLICNIESNQNNVCYPEYSIMNVLAEPFNLTHIKIDRTSKKRFNTVWGFDFLCEMIYANRINIQNIMKSKMKEMGVNVYLCKIPDFSDLQKYSLDEFYRNRKVVTPNSENLGDQVELNNIQLKKVHGNSKFKLDSALICTQLNIMELLEVKSKKYSNGENYIYILGPCIVDENYVSSDESLAFFIKKYVEERYGNKFAVITITIPFYSAFKYKEVIESLSIKQNDIVFCIDDVKLTTYKYKIYYEADIDLKCLFNSRPDDEEWFFDLPVHTNKVGNNKIAEYVVVNYFSKVIDTMDFEKEQLWLQKSNEFLAEEGKKELYKYINGIDKFIINKSDKIGAIVMNCNPFTFGHQYLIEQALKYVDFLYLFVVEENRSDFPFEDRIKLVKAATSAYENIKVIPSGRFILSYETMPIYFEKTKKQDVIVDASKDIEIFARHIATELGITVRMVGEEPLDNVTNQYNQEMKRLLSEYEIQFIVIPRVQKNGEVISASKVRKLLEKNSWKEIKKLVPVETYNYLKTRSNL